MDQKNQDFAKTGKYMCKRRPDQNWARCDDCFQWRKLTDGIDCHLLPENWSCSECSDREFRSCTTGKNYDQTYLKERSESHKRSQQAAVSTSLATCSLSTTPAPLTFPVLSNLSRSKRTLEPNAERETKRQRVNDLLQNMTTALVVVINSVIEYDDDIMDDYDITHGKDISDDDDIVLSEYCSSSISKKHTFDVDKEKDQKEEKERKTTEKDTPSAGHPFDDNMDDDDIWLLEDCSTPIPKEDTFNLAMFQSESPAGKTLTGNGHVKTSGIETPTMKTGASSINSSSPITSSMQSMALEGDQSNEQVRQLTSQVHDLEVRIRELLKAGMKRDLCHQACQTGEMEEGASEGCEVSEQETLSSQKKPKREKEKMAEWDKKILKRLRELRRSVGRLLVTFVPAESQKRSQQAAVSTSLATCSLSTPPASLTFPALSTLSRALSTHLRLERTLGTTSERESRRQRVNGFHRNTSTTTTSSAVIISDDDDDIVLLEDCSTPIPKKATFDRDKIQSESPAGKTLTGNGHVKTSAIETSSMRTGTTATNYFPSIPSSELVSITAQTDQSNMQIRQLLNLEVRMRELSVAGVERALPSGFFDWREGKM
ncbi:hypothetical protein DPEC_G00050300 [Dallia pectoralis]|uniref:Uncharacterized protein n=1 Tax=Dallia pectoralis TaxID=75939 RepID=A0ACC2HBR7_DALPE|nr:hypothetical protein DPEC_G00050300 [Dallia pectoralis]